IMINIAGASERIVNRMTICMAAEKFSRFERSGTTGETLGVGAVIVEEPEFAFTSCARATARGNSMRIVTRMIALITHPVGIGPRAAGPFHSNSPAQGHLFPSASAAACPADPEAPQTACWRG